MPFYAVARGRNIGIYTNWNACNENVSGFNGARFKKFSTLRDAERFIQMHADPLVALGMPAPQPIPGSSFGGSASVFIDLTSHQAHTSASVVDHQEPVVLDIAQIQAANDPQLNEALKRIENLKRQLEEVKSENERAGGPSASVSASEAGGSPSKKSNERGMIWIGRYKFMVDEEERVQVYINGCFNSRGIKSAGFGVYFGDNHELNMSQSATGRILHNCADIQAATECIRMAKGNGVLKLQINTDSEFLINAVTTWMTRWRNNGWTTVDGDPVRNKSNFVRLDAMMQTTMCIKWHLVDALAPGNLKAVEMAKVAVNEHSQALQVDVGQLVYNYLLEDHDADVYYYDGDDYYDEDYDDYDVSDSFIDDSDVSDDSLSSAEGNDE